MPPIARSTASMRASRGVPDGRGPPDETPVTIKRMPSLASLTSLKRSARELLLGDARDDAVPQQQQHQHQHWEQHEHEHQQTSAKRAFLRDLMGGAREKTTTTTTTITRSRTRRTVLLKKRPVAEQTQTSNSTTLPLSPRSIRTKLAVNSNKPLPSPPPPGTIDKADKVNGRPTQAVLKLNRIMATLTETEIEKLFSGAPQFFARSQGLSAGAPHPSVAFPYDEELAIRDLADHTQITDDAWGCVTAHPRIIYRDPLSATSPGVPGRRRPHFNTRCRERPNMLSMQGLEKGTIGYQAALEMAVADALREEQYGFDSLGAKGHVIIEQRQRLITSKDGLRHLDDASIMEQLCKVDERYHAERGLARTKPVELYNDLFRKVLHPPTRVIDHKDPYSLAVQIHALVRTLAAPNAWVDFSRVEWRIRLGQILWDFPLGDELSDGSSIREDGDAQERGEERYWLLLQILLACELLIRLDAITDGDEYGLENLKASEVHRFDKEANTSVRWSLILARSWLENIMVSKATTPVPSEPSTPKSWLTGLTSKMNLKHEHMHGAHFADHTQHRQNTQPEHTYTIQGRFPDRQVLGLMHFARKLRWPDVQTSVYRLSEKASALGEATPINNPLGTGDTKRSSYFGASRTSVDSISKQPVRRRRMEAALHPSGWLSKSYVSGLVLPGEALSHVLMSTLLETDDEAVRRLGPVANLCGGFVYGGKSFWSTACIVGRVLAAGAGSSECMGWISSDVTPDGLGDGWVNILVEDIHDDVIKVGNRARLWGKAAIERESDVLGNADPCSVFPADFILPHEGTYANRPPANIRIRLDSLNLFAPVDSVHTTPTEDPFVSFSGASRSPEIHTYPASISFSMSHDGLEQEVQLDYALSSDAYFVTAHPCVPSHHVKYMKSPTSPTIQQIDVGGNDFQDKPTSSAQLTGHPLHRYYKYTAVHLTDLLGQPSASLETLLSTGTPQSDSSAKGSPRVLVIDCITGFAPPPPPRPALSPTSPDMPALSRMSSSLSSSSFPMEPLTPAAGAAATPPSPPSPLQVKIPPPPPLSSGRYGRTDSDPPPLRRPDTAASAASAASSSTTATTRFERIDPPPPTTPTSTAATATATATAAGQRADGTRRRRFGSDLEVLARALCAERGWNAVVSRRRRGCLACAIREAGALGWKVVVRVE
ncbi:hypothetical protein GGR56DRAFT_674641 [Xylariaceae sp. FL0804]|nr:hypothetical protein GGR56DRAFT_674641 [Xylariaceae sp. FL0804]